MQKKISVFLAIVLLIMSCPVHAVASENSADQEAMINDLFDRRAELISLEKYDEVAAIDQQLESLGVEQLTPEEVKEKFIDTVMPGQRVVTPVSNNVTWMSSTTEYTYNGKTYVVQTLTAQPNANSSNLKTSGNKAIKSTSSWLIGSMNALAVLGMAVATSAPIVNVSVTVYDMVNAFIDGVSKTTVISNVEIVYSYSHVTTATFKYVKLKGQSDDMQSLTYISTKGTTAVGYQYPTFVYSGGSVSPNVIQGSRTIESTPNGYNSTLNAVKSYVDSSAASKACVGSVTITGIESKAVVTISPVCPSFPAHIY